ncbi:asparaginase [Viridibacillus arvi]|uniref:asparaginase n=1 Tax=Viridibacillus arvi TaxID=263475 RepID=UPI003D2BDB01
MTYDILIKEYRANMLENTHTGIICGVNEQLQTAFHVGDTEQYVFLRSAAKPIQAIPVFMTNIIEKYQLTEQESALFMASHRGESYQVDALESMLSKLPVEEEELYCAPSYPLNKSPQQQVIREGKVKRKLYHNCAGKHMGFITVCRELGYSVDEYWKPEHPLQQQILHILAKLSNMAVDQIKIGIDGCGVPVFAIPLENMAICFLKLGCPDLIEDIEIRKAVVKLTATMNRHNNMIASDNFICSTLLQSSNIVAKGGAQGVYCFALKEERIGIALKVMNGSEDVWPNIIASILEQINYKDKNMIQYLKELRPPFIKNDAGDIVGHIEDSFVVNQFKLI